MITVIITGNLGRDPEMRYTPAGQAVDPKTGGPRIWIAKDGTARADFEIVAERVEFLGGQQALIQADGVASDSETVPSMERTWCIGAWQAGGGSTPPVRLGLPALLGPARDAGVRRLAQVARGEFCRGRGSTPRRPLHPVLPPDDILLLSSGAGGLDTRPPRKGFGAQIRLL